jgi:hypothetical protein
MHSEAVTEAGAELVRLPRSVGLVRGETVALDGSKFRAHAAAGAGSATPIFSVRSSMPAVSTTAGWRSTLPTTAKDLTWVSLKLRRRPRSCGGTAPVQKEPVRGQDALEYDESLHGLFSALHVHVTPILSP